MLGQRDLNTLPFNLNQIGKGDTLLKVVVTYLQLSISITTSYDLYQPTHKIYEKWLLY